MVETSKIVFVDTEVFKSLSLNFFNSQLARLKRRCQLGVCQLIMPSLIKTEINRKIQDSVSDATQKINQLINNQFVTRVSGTIPLLEQLNAIDLSKTNRNFFEQYLSECDFQELNISDVDVDLIFRDYFASNPPFGAGKKKCEFPDAFAANAILNWANKNAVEVVHIVTNDSDWKAFCKRNDKLKYHPNLPAFYNEFSKVENLPVIEEALRFISGRVEEKVEFDFGKLGFDLRSNVVEPDVVDDVLNVKAVLLEVDNIDVSDAGGLIADIEFEIRFTAEITFEDFSEGIWDKEDQEWKGVDMNRTTIDRSWSGIVSVEFEFDETIDTVTNLNSISFPSRDIVVWADFDD